MNTPIGVIFLIAGLIIGPAYYTYVRFFTGEIVATQTVSFQQKSGKLLFDPIQLQLAPEMNDVGLIIRIDASHGPLILSSNPPKNKYHAIVSDGTNVLVDIHFSSISPAVDSTPSVSFQEALPLFKVNQTGTYQLKIAVEGETEMQILKADVQVRANTKQPNMTIIFTGIAFLAAGILAILSA
ncbi:hypothetical protein [Sulfurirhabdus autotrophica]|nr:hypothetical protein [Sulfurirhabdus autotrophica]